MTSKPAQPKPNTYDYVAPDGRTFDQLSESEREALVNGPRVSGRTLGLAIGLWGVFVLFLAWLALPLIR